MNEITNKNKLRQFFCKHRNTGAYKKQSPQGPTFYNLRGETIYTICKDCGKEIGEMFWEHEGMGFK